MTTRQVGHRRSFRLGLAGVVGSLIGLGAILPAATSGGVAVAAANSALTITPVSGSSVSGTITFAAPSPGCGTATTAVLRMKGPGITGDATGDAGFTNITAAVDVTPGAALSLTSDGNTWDNIAINKSIQRPLNGLYTVKIQCLVDGEITDLPFFDRDVTFTGSTNTWTVAGGGGGGPVTPTPTPTPTPTGSVTPTPTPASGATPTPEPDGKPTPEPDEECEPATEQCTETDGEGGGGDSGGDNEGAGGEGLPDSGGKDPSDALTIAALLLFSGLLFLALTVEGPRPGRYRQDDSP